MLAHLFTENSLYSYVRYNILARDIHNFVTVNHKVAFEGEDDWKQHKKTSGAKIASFKTSITNPYNYWKINYRLYVKYKNRSEALMLCEFLTSCLLEAVEVCCSCYKLSSFCQVFQLFIQRCIIQRWIVKCTRMKDCLISF